MNSRNIVKGFAILQIIITLGLSDAFFFNFIAQGTKDMVSGIVLAYIICQFFKTVISKKRHTYNYIYFAGLAGVLALYFSSFTVSDEVGAFIQFGIITTFMAVPIIDLFRKEKPAKEVE